MNHYYLLPFRFTRIMEQELLVNELGDFIFTPKDTTERIIKRQINNQENIYKDLVANFFISERPIPELIDNMATRLRTKKAFLDSFTSLHIFVLTLRCNQNCIYCQASSKESNEAIYDMKEEYLFKAIDLMFQSPSPSITMEFQGGEPSLPFQLLKKAVKRTVELNQEHRKQITYVLCTNSINLTEEILHLCKEYNILISTSLDGPAFIHNHNRGKTDSYNRVIEGINKVRNYLGADKVSALMTTSELSINHPKEIVDNYILNGFNNIFLRPLNPYGLALNSTNWNIYFDKFFEFYKQALNYIIDINIKGKFFVEEFTAILLRKILTPFTTGFVDLQSPAGIINNVVVYNYDGYVYASDESRMLAEYHDYTFRLGHVTDNYENLFYGDKAQQIALIWGTEFIAGCADCAFQSYCGADPVRNHSTQNDMYGFRPTSSFCKKHKAIITYLFSLIQSEHDRVMPIFKQWINRNENDF
ncbi:His-Xaa-Ser system radical SAM maturase HxsB [Bacteroides thetaiotaomicron]|uniref:His-Xaa-Ser system radical SAM maturase HxsB n=2 Tax=Bacteroides thetaiotaomicron TaxID=818 RepID=A0A7J5JIH8_BACT4|nr:His-Xaa-Ser system radical SAM maturase HxsB [Bacteroides thetaiotaomicron]KAB4434491.1 His-Xaa-Ser system radical SAM maturase HxsB [Bacteroides thetaiotaomicron]KAB4436288.1 His-Xaa-Ser system radical SAM maturase HxsB [Bacteroides thetaiotaomicron]KAB4438931.1 His-Xaa-Ser system radical SAM maturase HxsB [Bacteroides thetaiotaomicron]KAB4451203.1 His-Xaa-Ser system radical SAM maturase HxsB [Bacteroides thetaiotaomicron]